MYITLNSVIKFAQQKNVFGHHALFSFMKIADHPNLSDENLETNVSVTLELKAHDFEKFKA